MRPLVGLKLLSHEISWQICEDGLLSPAKKEGEGSGEPCSLASLLLLHHLCRHWQVPQGTCPGSSAIGVIPEGAPSHLHCSHLLKCPQTLCSSCGPLHHGCCCKVGRGHWYLLMGITGWEVMGTSYLLR